ncbi:MAG: Mur ligase family protein [Acidimicrobiales bacterium]
MDYQHALDWLESHTNLEGTAPPPGSARSRQLRDNLPKAGDTDGLSLGAMAELLSALGDPQHSYRVIHVTGTNGKGSTTRFAAAILATMGLSVGSYTSPNLVKVNERIGWDGNMISDLDLAQVLTLLADVEPLLSQRPSRFELLTAAALTWFAELGVEVAVVEVGLLGRYDATNLVEADVAVVTNIGKDHTDGADGWRQRVASEKAGIIKPGSRVVLGSPMGDLRPIFDQEPSVATYEFGADFDLESNVVALGGRAVDIRTPHGRLESVHVPFHGAHQGQNLATAVMAVEAFFDRPLELELIEEAMATVEIPGRFEIVGRNPIVILDGAHNPDGAVAAKRTLDEEFARLGSWVLVFGMLVGKDPVEMLRAIGAEDFDAVIVTQPAWSRALPASEVAAAAATLGIDVEIVPDVVDAFARARSVTNDDDLILVAGSLYVIGELRAKASAATTDN